MEYILKLNIVEDPLNALLQESSNQNHPATSVDQAKINWKLKFPWFMQSSALSTPKLSV